MRRAGASRQRVPLEDGAVANLTNVYPVVLQNRVIQHSEAQVFVLERNVYWPSSDRYRTARRRKSKFATLPFWDDGFDFALISYMEWEEAGRPIDYMKSFISVEPRERPDRSDPWHGVKRADQLAAAIHDAALGKYPDSTYAKLYGQPSE